MLDGWSTRKLGELADVKTGYPFKSTIYTEDENGIRLLRGDNVTQEGIRWDGVKRWPALEIQGLEEFHLKVGDLVIAMDRTWVKAGLKVSRITSNDVPSLLVQRVARIRAKAGIDQEFLVQSMNNYQFEQYVKGGQTETAVPHISPGDIKAFPIRVPPPFEQRRIAKILRTWDEAIENLQALHAAKRKYYSSILLRLFEAEYSSHDKLVRARNIFETVSERARPDLPLLAVMQDIGIVRRDDLTRRVMMPDGDTSNYKVVRPGDFVISLRSFEGGLEFSSITGLVSPAYTVLRPNVEIDGNYYRHFFKSRSFIGRIDKLIFGIRDGKQIAFRDFGDMLIPLPKIDAQKRQSSLMSGLEEDLAIETRRIDAIQRQKSGLMQKLLTGEWRASC